MKKLNIIENSFVEFPFDETKPFIEVDEINYQKIIDGDLIYKDGELVFNKKKCIIEEIEKLKLALLKTDYKALKFAEGILTEKEYEKTREERQGFRDRINNLEEELEEQNCGHK